MATTKTLAPTNQAITIDAFQDEKPDYRHVADAEGKLADAVNALNSQLVPTALTSATDFNTLTGTSDGKTTLYSGSNISMMSNIPSYFSGQTWPFILEVRKISQYAQQILHAYSSTGNPVDIWIRNQSYINGAVGWLGWEQIAAASQAASVTLASGVSNLFFSCIKVGNIVTLNGAVSLSNAIAGMNAGVITLPAGFRPSSARDIVAYTTYNGAPGMFHFTVKADGSIITNVGGNNVSGTIYFSCAFCL